jgi:hypothetical protein
MGLGEAFFILPATPPDSDKFVGADYPEVRAPLGVEGIADAVS